MENHALLQHRILFLSGIVTQENSNQLVSLLLLLDADSHTSPIDFFINSPGGSVTDGIAIIDAMQCIQAPVRTICIGQAASIGAYILAAGDQGSRSATPNAEVMIHQVGGGISGKAGDMQVQAERMIRLQDSLIKMLSGWTNQPIHRIREDLDRDFFMTAQEAREYGIIDDVLEPYKNDNTQDT